VLNPPLGMITEWVSTYYCNQYNCGIG